MKGFNLRERVKLAISFSLCNSQQWEDLKKIFYKEDKKRSKKSEKK